MEVLAGKARKGANEVNAHGAERSLSQNHIICIFTKAHPSNQASVIDFFRAHVQPPSAMRGSGLDRKVERNLFFVVYELYTTPTLSRPDRLPGTLRVRSQLSSKARLFERE